MKDNKTIIQLKHVISFFFALQKRKCQKRANQPIMKMLQHSNIHTLSLSRSCDKHISSQMLSTGTKAVHSSSYAGHKQGEGANLETTFWWSWTGWRKQNEFYRTSTEILVIWCNTIQVDFVLNNNGVLGMKIRFPGIQK